MSDDDLIRRGDALAVVQGLEYSCNAEEDIAALPAVTVGAMIAKVPTRYQTVNGDRLLHEGDLLAALEPVAAPDPAAIREAALYEALTDVLDAIGALSKPHELIGYGMSQDDIDHILALIQKGAAE